MEESAQDAHIEQRDAPVATVAEPAGQTGGADRPMDSLIRDAVRSEFDEVLPHVISALKRHDAVTDLARRLDMAEKHLAERNSRPLIAGIRRSLTMVRQLDFDVEVKRAILGELERLLVGAGYTEFGELGEPFDPRRHEVVVGEPGTDVTVLEIFEPGVETLGEVVVSARVRVGDSSKEAAA